ncbi:MAG: hypothetical protein JNM97_07910 [Rhodoferax sp.]|jgi:FMN reductase|nr:hypothetical protein [Rhodoferax sp.]
MTVLPLATVGSAHPTMALDYALRPVQQSMGARNILPCIFATDAQMVPRADGQYQPDRAIGERLDDAVHRIVTEHLRRSISNAERFAPVPFSQVQCSV